MELKISRRKIASPEALFKEYTRYEAQCDEDGERPTKPGFLVFLGCCKSTLDRMIREYSGLEDAFEIINTAIEDRWLQDTVRKPGGTNLMNTYLNNNHGYTWGKQEIKNTGDIRAFVDGLNADELAKRVKQFHRNNDTLIDLEEVIKEKAK